MNIDLKYKLLLETIFLMVIFSFITFPAMGQSHPCLYVGKENKSEIIRKIESEEWARTIWNKLLEEITPYADRHKTDSEWLVSRMSMYWEDGKRYTQCYLKKQNWDYATGNAPVPTVRMPGMRTWNEYLNVPLKDRMPYNKTGDMWGISRKNPGSTPVLVPYKESGHMIRSNNNEILQIAAKSAFIYFINNDEKFAKMAADIYNTWLLGTYYMQPIIDIDESSGGPGGFEPGGICGYYDYEQIHDDLGMRAAPIYDFLHDYLKLNPHPHLKGLKKDIIELSGVVFKRFIDIGMVRGGKSGNWNVNGWNMMMTPILVLEKNTFYEDGRGREYYLKYYTDISTPYHDALPDILKVYDTVTGLWPESPGYAMGTINMLVDLAIPIYKAGINTIGNNPVMQKAALAVFPWLDSRGNMVVFGDSRGGAADYKAFERLLTYYTWNNDRKNAIIVGDALQKGIESGQYDRSKGGWEDLLLNISVLPEHNITQQTDRMVYSPFHRHIIQKNGEDKETALMAILYGGTKGHHLTANGLAIQLYGMGWALGPDASGYESYWSKDVAYHQSVTGSNTIIPGYTDGPITIHAMEPFIPENLFVNPKEISPNCSFVDVSAGEKRRMLAVIRTSSSSGYYVDVFRSDQENNDYIFHNIGNNLHLFNTEEKLLTNSREDNLGNQYNVGYDFFSDQKSVNYNEDFQARWQIDQAPVINMNMWMAGQKKRSISTVNAPYTNFNKELSPNGVSMAPQPTPTLIVRQEGINAWKYPFIAIFEPYQAGNKSIRTIVATQKEENFTFLEVQSNAIIPELRDNKESICYAIDDKTYKPSENLVFRGTFGVVSKNGNGLKYLYLGRGQFIEYGDYSIEAEYPVSAAISNINGEWFYSSDGEVKIKIKKNKYTLSAGYNKKCEIK